MCAICVAAQDAAKPTGNGATADAWERFGAALDVWIRSLPDDHPIQDMTELERAMAWADHIDCTTVDRVIN